jgi:hypothetical protein
MNSIPEWIILHSNSLSINRYSVQPKCGNLLEFHARILKEKFINS